LKKIEQSYLKF